MGLSSWAPGPMVSDPEWDPAPPLCSRQGAGVSRPCALLLAKEPAPGTAQPRDHAPRRPGLDDRCVPQYKESSRPRAAWEPEVPQRHRRPQRPWGLSSPACQGLSGTRGRPRRCSFFRSVPQEIALPLGTRPALHRGHLIRRHRLPRCVTCAGEAAWPFVEQVQWLRACGEARPLSDGPERWLHALSLLSLTPSRPGPASAGHTQTPQSPPRQPWRWGGGGHQHPVRMQCR